MNPEEYTIPVRQAHPKDDLETTSCLEDALRERLRAREDAHTLRKITSYWPRDASFDFASNDYLGLASNPKLTRRAKQYLERFGEERNGSTGSRLLTGNSALAEAVEGRAAALHRADTATLFATGFNASQGLLGCVARKGDAILWDEQCHASLREGVLTSRASLKQPFRHSDLTDLETKLRTALRGHAGSMLVVVEGMYSMDGDLVPLKRLLTLCDRVGGRRTSVIIDEAHSAGILGKNGAGYVCERGFQRHPRLFARIVTLGKSFGVQGAFVLGPQVLRDYLLNYCRPLIYTTAPSPGNIASIMAAYDLMENDVDVRAARAKVVFLAEHFRNCVDALKRPDCVRLPNARLQINGILVPGSEACLQVAAGLQARGYGVLAIRSPTVPPGEERIRITIHSHNDAAAISSLVKAVRDLLPGRTPQQPAMAPKL